MKKEPTEYLDFFPEDYPGIKRATLRAAFTTLEGVDRLEGIDREDFERDFVYVSRVLRLLSEWRMPDETIWTFISCRSQPPTCSDDLLFGEDQEEGSAVGDLARLLRTSIKQSEPRKAYFSDKLRDLFVTAYTRLDITLLCLADHLARMSDVHLLGDKQAGLLIEESEVVFLPLLELLGCWRIRRKLLQRIQRNLSIPTKSKQIQEQMKINIKEKMPEYRSICMQVKERLKEVQIPGKISVHIHLPGSIYEADRQGRSIKDVARENRIDIILNCEEDCYRCLGIVHNLWPPVTHRTITGSPPLRDLLAMPKHNGYRCLITNVQYRHMLVEFRIYTQEMRRVNLEGVIAAKYLYPSLNKIKNAWWEGRQLKTAGQIYVFSPIGEVYHFPSGSTALDYAYRVHSDVGDYCKSVWINGQRVSHGQKLKDGDLIEIEVDPRYPGPYEEWQRIVKTTHAKSLITRSMKRYYHSPHRGREIIDKVLKRESELYDLTSLNIIDKAELEAFLEQVASYYKYSSLKDLYIDVAESKMSPDKIVARLIASRLAGHIAHSKGQTLPVSKYRVQFAHFKEGTQPPVHHRVIPGSEIIGRIVNQGTKNERLIVYRTEWPHAPQKHESEAIPLIWLDNRVPGMPVKISIQAIDRPRLLGSILEAIYNLYDARLYLQEIRAEVSREQLALVSTIVQAPYHEPIDQLCLRLGELQKEGTIDTFRVDSLSFIEKRRLACSTTLTNPYSLSPVSDNRVFKGRDKEIEIVLRALGSGHRSVVLYGLTRIGKTSLLLYLSKQVAGQNAFLPVFIDVHGLQQPSCSRFWQKVANRIDESISFLYGLRKGQSKLSSQEAGSLPSLQKYFLRINNIARGRKLLIIIDELSDIYKRWTENEAYMLINQIQSLLDQDNNSLNFILCLQETFVRGFQSEAELAGSSLFYTSYPLKLGYLERDAAESLVRSPMGTKLLYEDGTVDEILRVTACHPYFLQVILSRIIDVVNECACDPLRTQNLRVTNQVLDKAIARALGEGGDVYFYDFMVKGQDLGRIVVQALVDVVFSTEEDAVSLIEDYVWRHWSEVSRNEICRSLESLQTSGVISKSKSESGQNKYCFSVPLFERWLLEYK